jgi:hypothetical protein
MTTPRVIIIIIIIIAPTTVTIIIMTTPTLTEVCYGVSMVAACLLRDAARV